MLNNDGTVRMFENDYKGPVLMWPFNDAPTALKNLHPEGGQWIAHVPPWFTAMAGGLIGGLDNPDVVRHEIADGSLVFICRTH
jgi:hypothetical protein